MLRNEKKNTYIRMKSRHTLLLSIIIVIISIEVAFAILGKHNLRETGIALLSTGLLYTLILSNIINVYQFTVADPLG